MLTVPYVVSALHIATEIPTVRQGPGQIPQKALEFGEKTLHGVGDSMRTDGDRSRPLYGALAPRPTLGPAEPQRKSDLRQRGGFGK